MRRLEHQPEIHSPKLRAENHVDVQTMTRSCPSKLRRIKFIIVLIECESKCAKEERRGRAATVASAVQMLVWIAKEYKETSHMKVYLQRSRPLLSTVDETKAVRCQRSLERCIA